MHQVYTTPYTYITNWPKILEITDRRKTRILISEEISTLNLFSVIWQWILQQTRGKKCFLQALVSIPGFQNISEDYCFVKFFMKNTSMKQLLDLPFLFAQLQTGNIGYCFCQNHSQSSSVAWRLAHKPYFCLLRYITSLNMVFAPKIKKFLKVEGSREKSYDVCSKISKLGTNCN